MKLTKALKKWLESKGLVEAGADDDAYKKAAAEAIVSGDLTNDKLIELTTEEDDEAASAVDKRFEALEAKFDTLIDAVGNLAPKQEVEEEVEEPKHAETETKEVETVGASKTTQAISKMGGTPTEPGEPRVKDAIESYDSTKSAMHYPDRTRKDTPHRFAGERCTLRGRELDNPSDADKAMAGAWAKFQLYCQTPKLAGNAKQAWEIMTDHEKSLLTTLASEKCDWDNSTDKKDFVTKGYQSETGRGVKALIDDVVSGGLEAAPIVFDDMVISTPLLFGELYPLVNEVPLARGRRIEGVEVGQVTGSWGGVDDTAISLFNTASYVSAFDTTVYRWEGAVQIGLDFVSDTPIDFGSIITKQYGEKLLEDLDDVIAVGNGTTQPEGIMNSGATAVAFGGATSLSNYESLRFGVGKAEHKGPVGKTAVFCGNETSYSRAIGLPVGGSDTRRVFGMNGDTNYDGYAMMQRAYKINDTLTNQQVFYAILGRYRMYRRKGFTVRTSTEGDTLIRNNEMLIVVMARYGGQLERTACASLTTTAAA